MSSSIGKVAHCEQLICNELGSESQPVDTIHRASTDRYQNDLNWVDADTGHTRLRLKEDGHLQCVEDLEFFAGPSITSSEKRYSVGLNTTGSFVIRDEVNSVDLLTLDSNGLTTDSIVGLTAALNGKQAALSVNGQPVQPSILNTFTIASDGDGNPANSLVTAKAIEDWFEQLQNSLLMISPGQTGPGFRVGGISTTSPSSVNVPSCSAVSSFVSTKLASYQPVITATTNITAATVKSTATGFYESGQVNATANVIQWSTTGGSNRILLYNGTLDFDSLFAAGATVTISGLTTSIGGVPASDINGTRTVDGFYSHPLDPIEPGFYILADSFASSTLYGTFNPHATVSYGNPQFIFTNSDLLVHGGELYSYLQANYLTATAIANTYQTQSAMANYLTTTDAANTYLSLSDFPFVIIGSVLQLLASFLVHTIQLPQVELASAPATDAVRTFRRFKTTANEILADNENAPISCQSYTDSAQRAVIASTNANGYHLLSPNGATIHNHLSHYHPLTTVDSIPQSGSTNLITSGAVYTAVQGAGSSGTIDAAPIDGSPNAVASNGVFDSLALKQDALTFDTNPTQGSSNPITSGGVHGVVSGSNVRIGNSAGSVGQGGNSIAIGAFAGQTNQAAASIVINATGTTFNAATNGFFVSPIRTRSGGGSYWTASLPANIQALGWDYTTGEIVRITF